MPLQPAVLGTARLNNFRLGYVPAALVPVRITRIQIWLDGALATWRVRREGFTIHDLLNDSPNTCTLTIEGTPPPEDGMALRVTINSDAPRVLFAGTLQLDAETFEGRPHQLAYPCRAVDDTGRINKRRPFGTFTTVSATTVAQTLVAQFAPGFSAAGIAAALPLVTITFDGSLPFMGALARLAKLIGGYCNVDDGVVYLFLSGPSTVTTPILAPTVARAAGSGIELGVHQYAYTFATAAGETLPGPTAAITVQSMAAPAVPGYSAPDTAAVPNSATATVGDTFEWYVTYSLAPTYLDVTNESPRSPTTGAQALVASVFAGPTYFRQPLLALTASSDPGVQFIHLWARRNGGAYYLAYSAPNATAVIPMDGRLYDGVSVTPAVPAPAPAGLTQQVALAAVAVGPSGTTARKVYRTVAGGAQLKLQQTIANNTATVGVQDATPDASLGANAPTTDTSGLAVDPDGPNPITAGYPFLHDPPITATRDDSQLATRVYGKGHAEALLVDVAASETILPVADGVMYNAGGGQVITSTTPDGAVSEILGYRGVILPGPGTIVGSGASPSVAPALAPADGAGLTAGTYRYAYTDVTPSGESLPSPLGSIVLGGNVPDPTANPTVSVSNAGAATYPLVVGGTYAWCYTFTTALGETLPSPVWTVGPLGAGGPYHASVGISLGPAGTTGRKVYRTTNGGLTLKLSGAVANNTALFYDDQTLDGALGAGVPTVNAAVKGLQVAISGVGLGGGATTARKVYRTIVNGAQLKLQQTIANNTATVGAQDATADGALGATAPSTDTSVLTQPVGQILGGSTTIPTVGLGTLPAAGWVRSAAGDVIRYTGVAGNALTGIPATGAGAIVTTILYGDVLVAAPALTGVTGLTKALAKGSPVHLWVQRDDLAAQAAAAARESTDTYSSDGVHELTISDARLAETTLNAWCDAQLALFADPIVTVAYATRDVKTKSGKTVTISLPSPAIAETLTIQEVTITEMDVAPGTPPRFTVLASSVRFSLEDTLRRLSALLET